jgi:hypothetical protein
MTIHHDVTVHGPNKPTDKSPVNPLSPGGTTRRVLPVRNEWDRGRKPVFRDELAVVVSTSANPRERIHHDRFSNIDLSKPLTEKNSAGLEIVSLSDGEVREIRAVGMAVIEEDGIGTHQFLIPRPLSTDLVPSLQRWKFARQNMSIAPRGVFISPSPRHLFTTGIYETPSVELHKIVSTTLVSMNDIVVSNYKSSSVLASCVARRGHQVSIVETRYNPIQGFLDKESLDIVSASDYLCITATSFEEPIIQRLVWQIRNVAPKIPIMMGGWGPTVEEDMNFESIDPDRRLVPRKFVSYLKAGLIDLLLIGDGRESLPQALSVLLEDCPANTNPTDRLQRAYSGQRFVGGAVLLDENQRVMRIGAKQEKFSIHGGQRVLMTPLDTCYREHKHTRSRNLRDSPSSKMYMKLLDDQRGFSGVFKRRLADFLISISDSGNFVDVLQEGCPWGCRFCRQSVVNNRGQYLSYKSEEELVSLWLKKMQEGDFLTGNSPKLAWLSRIGIHTNDYAATALVFLSGDNVAFMLEGARGQRGFADVALHLFVRTQGRRGILPGLAGQFTTCRLQGVEWTQRLEVESSEVDDSVILSFDDDELAILFPDEALEKARLYRVVIPKKEWDRALFQGALMEMAQFRWAAFGIESLDPRILRIYHKETEPLDAVLSLRALREGMTVRELRVKLGNMRETARLDHEADKLDIYNEALKLLESKKDDKRVRWTGSVQAFTILSPDNLERDDLTEKFIEKYNAIAQRLALVTNCLAMPPLAIREIAKSDKKLPETEFVFATTGLDYASREDGSVPHVLVLVEWILKESGNGQNVPGKTIYNLAPKEWAGILQNESSARTFREWYRRTETSLQRLNNDMQMIKTFYRSIREGTSVYAAASRGWTGHVVITLRKYQEKKIKETIINAKRLYARLADNEFILVKNVEKTSYPIARKIERPSPKVDMPAAPAAYM